jgi:hypothetical protein
MATLEDQIISLLTATLSNIETPRKAAELQLLSLYHTPGFALALGSVGSHVGVPLNIRQAALLYLRQFVQAAWSSEFDEFKGVVLVSDQDKVHLRGVLLDLALNCPERKLKKAASYVVSKIGSADFPDEWADLLPTVLRIVQTGNEDQVSGALKVLADLLDDSFNEEQFFGVAHELVGSVYNVASNDSVGPLTRALAISVFRATFDILEMILEEHKAQVKNFADETLATWIPFLIGILESKLPPPPTAQDESQKAQSAETYRGLVAFKLQTVKTLMRIKSIFSAHLTPQSPVLFAATWAELSVLQTAYHDMFIEDQRQGRLEDDDGLPYTLDFLILEELDFMQACLKASPVKKQLETQLAEANGTTQSWITEVMQLAVSYAQITTEEEALWNIDVNIFLSEETLVTANYTPRAACGELVAKLADWLGDKAVGGLLEYARILHSNSQSWKARESALYILNQMLNSLDERTISSDAAVDFTDFIRYAMQQPDEFLRARGYLVAGSLIKNSSEALAHLVTSFMEATLDALVKDESEVVKVSCIRALQYYIERPELPGAVQMQGVIIDALSHYIQSQDLTERTESDDFMANLVATVRDAILLDEKVCLNGEGLTLLFTIANYGAAFFTISSIVTETFEDVVTALADAHETYEQLSAKVLPTLSSAFHVSSLTDENALMNLAAELLSILTKHASEPMPPGFVGAVMPKLNRILLDSTDEELLKAATCSVRNMLSHDPTQLFDWHDESGKTGLEAVLVIIDRLLGPTVDDNAGAEVGGLAAELVEKAGSERLGPYLMQLLRAVAVRLGSASQAQFIQSLILVFARLALVNAREVVDFLAEVQMGTENGLWVVIAKWLENSVNFAGYEEIRQKCVPLKPRPPDFDGCSVLALSKIYDLDDPRLSQITVKGDLIVQHDDNRIMTRSRAKQREFPPPTVGSPNVPPEPDCFTIVPANLKIIKVLVEELHSAAGSQREIDAAALDQLEEAGSDDGDWEDDPDTLDLGSLATRQGKTRTFYRFKRKQANLLVQSSWGTWARTARRSGSATTRRRRT